eukprot:scaffold127886_cov21-Tisochrysis_lutea.AAC.1
MATFEQSGVLNKGPVLLESAICMARGDLYCRGRRCIKKCQIISSKALTWLDYKTRAVIIQHVTYMKCMGQPRWGLAPWQGNPAIFRVRSYVKPVFLSTVKNDVETRILKMAVCQT